CALMSFGSPCVAHLVWPIPGPPLNRAGRLDPRPATRVLALCTRSPPDRFATASPAESYPRYSSWASPSSKKGTQSRPPTCATIPHTRRSLSLPTRRTSGPPTRFSPDDALLADAALLARRISGPTTHLWGRRTHRSAVDDPAKLPQRQLRRSHSPRR